MRSVFDPPQDATLPLPTVMIPLDPAARNLSLGGKYKFTIALSAALCCTMIQEVILNGGFESLQANPMIGPSVDTILAFGGISREIMMNPWESYRLLWACFLHAGIFHLATNLIILIAMGTILEPEWGALRTGFSFAISGIGGNLMSSVMNRNVVSVGSSGGIYGLTGAYSIYILEYWQSIPNASAMFTASVLVTIGCVITSFVPLIDVFAHIGGLICGILFALMTIQRQGWRNKLHGKAPEIPSDFDVHMDADHIYKHDPVSAPWHPDTKEYAEDCVIDIMAPASQGTPGVPPHGNAPNLQATRPLQLANASAPTAVNPYQHKFYELAAWASHKRHGPSMCAVEQVSLAYEEKFGRNRRMSLSRNAQHRVNEPKRTEDKVSTTEVEVKQHDTHASLQLPQSPEDDSQDAGPKRSSVSQKKNSVLTQLNSFLHFRERSGLSPLKTDQATVSPKTRPTARPHLLNVLVENTTQQGGATHVTSEVAVSAIPPVVRPAPPQTVGKVHMPRKQFKKSPHDYHQSLLPQEIRIILAYFELRNQLKLSHDFCTLKLHQYASNFSLMPFVSKLENAETSTDCAEQVHSWLAQNDSKLAVHNTESSSRSEHERLLSLFENLDRLHNELLQPEPPVPMDTKFSPRKLRDIVIRRTSTDAMEDLEEAYLYVATTDRLYDGRTQCKAIKDKYYKRGVYIKEVRRFGYAPAGHILRSPDNCNYVFSTTKKSKRFGISVNPLPTHFQTTFYPFIMNPKAKRFGVRYTAACQVEEQWPAKTTKTLWIMRLLGLVGLLLFYGIHFGLLYVWPSSFIPPGPFFAAAS